MQARCEKLGEPCLNGRADASLRGSSDSSLNACKFPWQAPYREAFPLSLDHRLQISEQTFEGVIVESMEVIKSAAWPATAEGVEREQILVVLAAYH